MDGSVILPAEATETASRVDSMFLGLVLISTLIILLVAGLVVSFSAHFRRSAPASRKLLPEWISRETEIIWTATTLFAFLFIFWWAGALDMTIISRPENPIRIHVVAKQWMWKAEHAGGMREINELHLPAGRDVLVSLNSQDVIHSFYVPAFRLKRDVLPGRTEQIWFRPVRPGRYHLFCAEYCGTNHSRMTGWIVVMKPENFAAWAAGVRPAGSLVQKGARLFRAYGCSGCHVRGTIRAPNLRGVYGSPVPLSDGRVVTADAQYIRDSILFPQKDIAAGYVPVMPSFDGLLTDDELLELVEYIKSLGYEERHD